MAHQKGHSWLVAWNAAPAPPFLGEIGGRNHSAFHASSVGAVSALASTLDTPSTPTNQSNENWTKPRRCNETSYSTWTSSLDRFRFVTAMDTTSDARATKKQSRSNHNPFDDQLRSFWNTGEIEAHIKRGPTDNQTEKYCRDQYESWHGNYWPSFLRLRNYWHSQSRIAIINGNKKSIAQRRRLRRSKIILLNRISHKTYFCTKTKVKRIGNNIRLVGVEWCPTETIRLEGLVILSVFIHLPLCPDSGLVWRGISRSVPPNKQTQRKTIITWYIITFDDAITSVVWQ